MPNNWQNGFSQPRNNIISAAFLFIIFRFLYIVYHDSFCSFGKGIGFFSFISGGDFFDERSAGIYWHT